MAAVIGTRSEVGKRKARKQVARLFDDTDDGGRGANIWWGNKKRRRGKDPAKTRCDPAKDSGTTRGSECRVRQFCLFFSRGACNKGMDCHKLHLIPDEDDDLHLTNDVDCFGRERTTVPANSANGEDDGVGCLFTENRTLWVGGIPFALKEGEARERLRQEFSAWGEVVSVRMVSGKGCAFVQFRYRANAEFAREAMANQSLGAGGAVGDTGAGTGAARARASLDKSSKKAKTGAGSKAGASSQMAGISSECGGVAPLWVKWASEDPNPRAVQRETQRKAQTLLAAQMAKGEVSLNAMALPKRDRALLKRLKIDQPTQQQQLVIQQQQQQMVIQEQWAVGGGQYPNTDGQYATGQQEGYQHQQEHQYAQQEWQYQQQQEWPQHQQQQLVIQHQQQQEWQAYPQQGYPQQQQQLVIQQQQEWQGNPLPPPPPSGSGADAAVGGGGHGPDQTLLSAGAAAAVTGARSEEGGGGGGGHLAAVTAPVQEQKSALSSIAAGYGSSSDSD